MGQSWNVVQYGAGLFDLRSLSNETLSRLHDEIGWRESAAIQVGPKAETLFASMIRRILIERGALG